MSHDVERPGEDDDLVIRGEIETTSVPELLRSLLGSGETGVLTIRNGEAVKSIFILNGRVAYASSNNPDERMGEVMLVRGKITVRSFVEASKRIRPGLRLGAIEDRRLEQTRCADVEETARRIGWRAAVSLDEGLDRTIEWYRAYFRARGG